MNNNLININKNISHINQNLIESFLANKVSPQTKKAYRTDLRLFLQYSKLNSIEDLLCLDFQQIVNLVVDYRNSITKYNESGMVTNLNSIARKIYSLKAFFSFLVKFRIISENPMSAVDNVITPTEGTTNGLSLLELRTIFSVIDKDTLIGKRDRAILQILYNTAIRRSNAASLKMSSITAENGTPVLKFIAKRNKYMVIPLKDEVLEAINDYLKASGRSLNSNSNEFIFRNHSNYKDKGKGHISPEGIFKMVLKYSQLAKISKRITPHSFRVTSITIALDAGAQPRQVMAMSGHASLQTLNRYDRIDRLKNNATFMLPSLS